MTITDRLFFIIINWGIFYVGAMLLYIGIKLLAPVCRELLGYLKGRRDTASKDGSQSRTGDLGGFFNES
jgi:hypothetical protein